MNTSMAKTPTERSKKCSKQQEYSWEKLANKMLMSPSIFPFIYRMHRAYTLNWLDLQANSEATTAIIANTAPQRERIAHFIHQTIWCACLTFVGRKVSSISIIHHIHMAPPHAFCLRESHSWMPLKRHRNLRFSPFGFSLSTKTHARTHILILCSACGILRLMDGWFLWGVDARTRYIPTQMCHSHAYLSDLFCLLPLPDRTSQPNVGKKNPTNIIRIKRRTICWRYNSFIEGERAAMLLNGMDSLVQSVHWNNVWICSSFGIW